MNAEKFIKDCIKQGMDTWRKASPAQRKQIITCNSRGDERKPGVSK